MASKQQFKICVSSLSISPAYEELLEVVTRAVAKLNINWPRERQVAHKKSRLYERFLQPQSQHSRQGLPCYPDLHNVLCKSLKRLFSFWLSSPSVVNYSYILGAKENGYEMMPRVEEPLASYLSTDVASSLKAFDLVGRAYMAYIAYMAAGRAGACLHTMASLQTYQADLLKDCETGWGPVMFQSSLSLCFTKETARGPVKEATVSELIRCTGEG